MLAERVLRVEAALYQSEFDSWPLDERLAAEFPRRICHDLVPDWAGRWRIIAVRVGNFSPPPPHQVPILMRDYGADLQARWPAAAAAPGDVTLELLAFAEGRFLSIHPFQDFNGRTIRLFLLELLRRWICPASRSPRKPRPTGKPTFRRWKPPTAPTGSRSCKSGNSDSPPRSKTHETVSHPT